MTVLSRYPSSGWHIAPKLYCKGLNTLSSCPTITCSRRCLQKHKMVQLNNGSSQFGSDTYTMRVTYVTILDKLSKCTGHLLLVLPYFLSIKQIWLQSVVSFPMSTPGIPIWWEFRKNISFQVTSTCLDHRFITTYWTSPKHYVSSWHKVDIYQCNNCYGYAGL